MGYTHYWNKKEVDENEYTAAIKDIAKIVNSKKNILADGTGDKGTKPTTTGEISFNGIDDKSHETFFLPKTAAEMKSFDFCKTARKPYDIVVTACLCRLGEVKGISVSSDGSASDWTAGVALASKVLGRKVSIPSLNEEEEEVELPPLAKKTTPSEQLWKKDAELKNKGSHLKLVKSYAEKIATHYATNPRSFLKKVTAKKDYEDFEAFSKVVGIISDESTLKKIGAPVGISSFDGDRWSAESESAKALSAFVKKNPKYHVVTQMDPIDHDDGSMTFLYYNAMHGVNRLSYYLADGNKDTSLNCADSMSRD